MMKKIYTLLLITFVSSNTVAKQFEEFTAPPEQIISEHAIQDYPNIWWQWAYSLPKPINPVRDLTGENCHQGQSGDVWFLAGGFGSSTIKRKCEIPAGKFIFFPVINMVYYKSQEGEFSCDDAKKYAALNNDKLIAIDIELDGVKASNPAHTRLSSEECFNIFERLPKEAGAYNAFPSATDGYWVMLKPLPKGKHTLKFKAGYNREKDGAFGKMAQDIEYELEIK